MCQKGRISNLLPKIFISDLVILGKFSTIRSRKSERLAQQTSAWFYPLISYILRRTWVILISYLYWPHERRKVNLTGKCTKFSSSKNVLIPYGKTVKFCFLIVTAAARRKLIDSSGRKKNACQINSHGKAQELFVYNTLIKDKKEISHMHYPWEREAFYYGTTGKKRAKPYGKKRDIWLGHTFQFYT